MSKNVFRSFLTYELDPKSNTVLKSLCNFPKHFCYSLLLKAPFFLMHWENSMLSRADKKCCSLLNTVPKLITMAIRALFRLSIHFINIQRQRVSIARGCVYYNRLSWLEAKRLEAALASLVPRACVWCAFLLGELWVYMLPCREHQSSSYTSPHSWRLENSVAI